MEYKDIIKVKFDIFSLTEIKNNSVCEITSSKIYGQNTVYDERMGVLDQNKKCETCNNGVIECPGHFGHIKLEQYIYHPLYIDNILSLLNVICYSCGSLLLTLDEIRYNKISLNLTSINKLLKTKLKLNQCYKCKKYQLTFMNYNDKIYEYMTNNKYSIISDIHYIYELFGKISNDDLQILNINTNPQNYIIVYLPIIPPCCRSFILINGNHCEDDLTHQYIEIIKINKKLKLLDKSNITDKNNLIDKLIVIIKLLYNNKCNNTGEHVFKSISSRWDTKTGRMRGNLMGKRVNFCGRTVVTPDSTLPLNVIGVPECFSNILTIPEICNNFNIDRLKLLQLNNKITNKLDKNGEPIVLKKNDQININDTIERYIEDNDYILMNRQPSLHKLSMLGFKIKLLPSETFRFNLSACTSFNADFDGDELNGHIPQSIMTNTELKELLDVGKCVINPQNNKPAINIIQDSLTGSYLMTITNQDIDDYLFFDSILALDFKSSFNYDIGTFNLESKIDKYCELHNTKNYKTTFFLISLLFPNDFNYDNEHTCDFKCDLCDFKCIQKIDLKYHLKSQHNITDLNVIIKDGIYMSGTLSKLTLGCVNNSIIQILYKEYNDIIFFVSGLQQLTRVYLLANSFSIGIQDCICNYQNEIDNHISKTNMKIKYHKYNDTDRTEKLILNDLNNTKNIGQKMVSDKLNSKNGFKIMAECGSKGSSINAAQIMAMVGQQNIYGKRVQPNRYNFLTNKKRTFPHFKDSNNIESRGFVKNSYIKGLTPIEFFCHAQSAREGITDTACKTATTGYISRRIVKSLEDLTTDQFGTVRTCNNKIIQILYGYNGFDPTKLLNMNGRQIFIDVFKLAYKLNNL